MKDSKASARISRKEPQLISNVCYKCCIDEQCCVCHVVSPDLVQPFFFFILNKAKALIGEDLIKVMQKVHK